MRLLVQFVVCVAILAGFESSRAQAFPVYVDQLENNWQNWSWCTVDLANRTHVYSGKSSIEITYTGGYQGFYLHSGNDLHASDLSTLTFEITGGGVAGRSISVSAIVNYSPKPAVNLNNYIAGGKAPASGWSQVTIPVSALGLGSNDLVDGFWLQESSGTSQAPFWIDQIAWNITPPPSSPTIDVRALQPTQPIDPKLFGVNTAVWDTALNSSLATSLVAKSGFKAFRFPGGSLSDTYDWLTNTTTGGISWNWGVDFDQFASIAAGAKGQCFITANYGTGTPAEAAQWVAYSNVTKGYGLKYWEVGNEVYGTWETDSHARPNDPVIYAQQFAQYYKQMKAQDGTIQVGAVAAAGEDSYANYSDEVVTNPVTGATHSGWTPVMLSTLASLGVKPDFIIYHRYPEYLVESDFPLLTGNDGWATDIGNLRQQLNDYLGANAAGVQIMCTENNADAGNPGKQMCSLVNGLYMADSFGSVLNTECKSYMWWDLINGQSTTGDQSPWLYGWRPYGDEGVMSPDLSTLYPVYYIEQLLNQFQAGDMVLSTTSNYGLLTPYAAKRADGSLRVLVVNKNSTLPVSAAVSLVGYVPKTLAKIYRFGISEDNEAKNGQPQSVSFSEISCSGTTTVRFPAYSATIVEFQPLQVTAKP